MAKGQKIKSLWENIGINAAAPGIIGKLLLLSNLSWVDAHNPCSCVGLYLGRRSEHSQSVGRFHAPSLLPLDHHGIAHTEPTLEPETEHHRSTDYYVFGDWLMWQQLDGDSCCFGPDSYLLLRDFNTSFNTFQADRILYLSLSFLRSIHNTVPVFRRFGCVKCTRLWLDISRHHPRVKRCGPPRNNNNSSTLIKSFCCSVVNIGIPFGLHFRSMLPRAGVHVGGHS